MPSQELSRLSRIALAAVLLGLCVSALGCATSPKAKPPKSYILRAGITEVFRQPDGRTSIRMTVWHVGPRGGDIVPGSRIRLVLRNYWIGQRPGSMEHFAPGHTMNYLIDQTESEPLMKFNNVRFAPLGSQETIPLARGSYRDKAEEILIEQEDFYGN